MQELSRQNEELQKQINELKGLINDNAKHNMMVSNATLEQNIPNPFNKTITVAYTLPQKFSNAQIVIKDKTGKMVNQINVSGTGKGSVSIDGATLPSGIYNYTLIVDKRIVSSKQMIFGK